MALRPTFRLAGLAGAASVRLGCQTRSGAAAISFIVRPDSTLRSSSLRLPLPSSRACSSRSLISSHRSLPLALAHPSAPASSRPAAGPVQAELELAGGIVRPRVADRLPGAPVPEHDRAAAILALGDGALERAVVERMVLDMDGEPALGRVQARALRHRPALQHAVQLEAEVVVQASRCMLLHHEAETLGGPPSRSRRTGLLATGLGRAREVPLGAVAREPAPGAVRLRRTCGHAAAAWVLPCRRRAPPRLGAAGPVTFSLPLPWSCHLPPGHAATGAPCGQGGRVPRRDRRTRAPAAPRSGSSSAPPSGR